MMVDGIGVEEAVVAVVVNVGVVVVVDLLVVDLLVEGLVVEELDGGLVDGGVAGEVGFVTDGTVGSVASVVAWS